jgi:hypothetical protein
MRVVAVETPDLAKVLAHSSVELQRGDSFRRTLQKRVTPES